MGAETSRQKLLELLRNPEFATQHFIEVAKSGTDEALLITIGDILNATGCALVKLTKSRSSPNAACQAGNWNGYKFGAANNHCSLPVEYCLTGLLVIPPKIGSRVRILRISRNDVQVAGIFESTAVVAVTEAGFTTQNSIYRVDVLCASTAIDQA